MKTEKLYLAVDSGGSKTVWILLNKEGSALARIKTGGLGAASEGLLPVFETVKEAYTALLKFGTPSAIYLSLGGPNISEVESALRSIFGEDISILVEREACGNAILAAAKFMGCSATVMCGTGSVAVGDTKEGRKYSGGWGPVYGDGGSGGGMGSDALRAFLRSVDTKENLGGVASLFSPLTEDLDISSFSGRMELKRRAIGMMRHELAALAPKIYSLAQAGDGAALYLYKKSAREISELALGVSESSEDFCVLLCGGFFTDKPILLDLCEEYFAKSSKAKLKYEPKFSPIVAAQMAALSLGDVKITNELFTKLLNN